MKNSLIFIVGPTGVGKSDVGFLLAKDLNGEIVNADSMQVYRGIDIASDKPSIVIQTQIRHHLIDVVDPTETFDVAQYRQLALAAIEDIQKRGKIPIILGGSGMYINVLLDGIFDKKASDEALREQLFQEAGEKGASILHDRLKALDPIAAARIHPNDAMRLVRALEVVTVTGEPISQLQQERQGLWGTQPIAIIGLNRDRELLYRRVEQRVELMFDKGLVEEIRAISHLPLSRTCATLIGIPEVLAYLKGEHDLERAKYLMKLNTRHFAKRQLTWFRRDLRIRWIDINDGETATDIVQKVNS